MANFTEDKIKTIWEKAQKVEGEDPNTWRKDVCDAWINFQQYGTESDYGWGIDHTLPVAKGGTDNSTNLRAMHWQNNRGKGDDFPHYLAELTSEGDKNIEKKNERTIHHDIIERLKVLYPNNIYLQTIKTKLS